jgi:hypothetical protein
MGTLASAGCGSDGQASPDAGTDAGQDAGPRSPACTTEEDCNDGDRCTSDRCDAELGCIHELIDGDGDGYAEGVCTGAASKGGDCNDTNETVYPGAPELCDGLDNDCDDTVDDEIVEVVCSRDADGDGFGWRTDVVAACNCPEGYIPPRSDAKFDCADNDAGRNPGHTVYETSGYCSVGICQIEFTSYDWDCSGDEEMEFPSLSDGSCRLVNVGSFFVCRGSGWVQSIADCGDSDSYRSCDSSSGCSETIIPSQAQTCR